VGSDVDHNAPAPADDTAARDAAMAEWERPAKPAGGRWRRLFKREPWREEFDPADADEDGYVAPRRRAAFPPSFLLIWAVGLGVLAIEPTVNLGYQLFGPSQVIDLGQPGEYHLDAARDGARVSLSGFIYNDRGSFSQYLSDYEVVALTNLPVLVRRAPTRKPPPDVAELYQGEGRLLKLDDSDGSFFERLVRPAARYAGMRRQFVAFGQLPANGPCWLLLDGELPRTHWSPLVAAVLLWSASFLFAFQAWRSYRLRNSPRRVRSPL
jgi:hypothetical protein